MNNLFLRLCAFFKLNRVATYRKSVGGIWYRHQPTSYYMQEAYLEMGEWVDLCEVWYDLPYATYDWHGQPLLKYSREVIRCCPADLKMTQAYIETVTTLD